MIPVFLDVETTGFDDDDRIVQVAYKTPNFKGAESLFDPSPKKMGVGAMAVCHITNKMIAGAPVFPGSPFANQLYGVLSEPDHVLVAHNAEFDMKFLVREGFPQPPRHICTYKVAYHQDEMAELPKHTLQYLRYHFFEDEEFGGAEITAHSALSDVLVLERLFNHLLEKNTIEEMIEISSKPMLVKKFSFGKYKGEWIKDVARKDPNYLLWMKREMSNIDKDLLFTINHWIANRRDL